jgi:O-antigen ligase
MNEILSTTAIGLAAILVTIGVVLVIALVLHWGYKKEEGLIPYIFYPIVLIIPFDKLFSGRNLDLTSDFVLSVTTTQHPVSVVASRVCSLFFLFVVCERIARRFLHSGYKPDAPTLLIMALWLYFLTNIVSSVFLGTRASFSHSYLYSVLVGSGALLLSQHESNTVVCTARNAFFILIVLSAVMLVFRPELVISTNYIGGLIPGFNLRYYGLSNHPNAFAPLIVVFIMCLWSRPFSAYWVNRLGWIIGCVSLVLTQSKTCWIAMATCVICTGYFRYGDFFRQRIFHFRHSQFLAALLFLVMLFTGVLGFIIMFADPGEVIYSFFATNEGATLLSLTGRDQIWEAAIREWKNNPLFGYGLTIWDNDYLVYNGLPTTAVSAHSQFYQSLSSAGIIGVVGLVIYAITLFQYALKTAKSSLGLSISLFIVIFAESFSETPLMIVNLGQETLPHLLLLMVIASHLVPKNVKNLGVKAQTSHKFVSPAGVA